MAVLLIVLLAFSLYYWVYESIIGPLLRYRSRLTLFALRDELRWAKIDSPDCISDELYEELDGTLSTAIRLGPIVNVVMLARAKQFVAGDADFEARMQRIRESDDARIVRINEEMGWSLFRLLLINHGGWAPLVIPPIFAWAMVRKIVDDLYRLLRDEPALMSLPSSSGVST